MLRLIKDVDDKTGEIKRERQHYIEDMFNEDGYKVPIHKLGAKMFSDISFPDEMNDSEVGKMARLSKLMVATTNMIGYRSRSGILPYTEKQLIDLLKMSRYRGKEFIEKMIWLGVMQRNKRIYRDIESEEFYINPAYFFAGRRISLSLYLLFREHLDSILPEYVRREFWQAAKAMEKPACQKQTMT